MSTVLVALFLVAPARAAVTNEDCLGCHDTLKGVSHGGAGCIDCHSAITDVPHAEKLPKPVCATCHPQEAGHYGKDVHKTQGLDCEKCHNAHNPDTDKKECITCHGKVSHAGLPATERHLSNLACVACHAKPDKTRLVVQVIIKGSEAPAQTSVDRDSNGIVDKAEWQRFRQALQGSTKGSTLIETSYKATGGLHTISAKPAACATCHGEGGYFKDASLRVSDSKSYQLRIDPRIFIPVLPSAEEFSLTVHGKNGVTCTDCHGSEKKTDHGWSIDSSVCARCHDDVTKAYSSSAHGRLGAAMCLDCHNPHRIRTYKELTARERINVCARCHTGYIKRHEWLPNTTLHFSYLECATCHSPRSEKSMVYFFARESAGRKTFLSYDRLTALSQADPIDYVESHKTTNDGNDAGIGALFTLLRKQDKDAVIDASILVTKAYHDYSEIPVKEKRCVTCHSREANFYESMFFAIPGKESTHYIPVKGTLFSSYPIGTAVDLFLLGEYKLEKRDFATFMGLGKGGQAGEHLGFKLIDLFGIVVILLALFGVCIHVILRILVRILVRR